MRRLLQCLMASGLPPLCSACGREQTSGRRQGLEVVATSRMLLEFARQVGGKHVHVRTLVGPDGGSRTCEPTPQDSVALQEAKLVFEKAGLNPDRRRYILLVLMALAVVAGIQAVGVVLTSALLVAPVATAGLMSKRLVSMMIIAAVIACASGICGLYGSYYLSVSSGGAIVLVCTVVFAGVFNVNEIRSGIRRTKEASR